MALKVTTISGELTAYNKPITAQQTRQLNNSLNGGSLIVVHR